MSKNFKIIQISGIPGLLFIMFIFMCLAYGFVVFPAMGLKYLWNEFLHTGLSLPVISLFQAFLLWAAFVIMFFLILRNKVSIKFNNSDELNEEHCKNIINRLELESKEPNDENVQ
ncbi:MAG: hypothetical protein PHX18_05135 [Candidatus Gastranaerophilales bacterium]|nr:hypothetical protein [Candidatus Gastranaerophilales bacterium]